MPDTPQDKKATLLRALLAELIPMAGKLRVITVDNIRDGGIRSKLSTDTVDFEIHIHEEDIIRAKEGALIARAHQEMTRARALLGA